MVDAFQGEITGWVNDIVCMDLDVSFLNVLLQVPPANWGEPIEVFDL